MKTRYWLLIALFLLTSCCVRMSNESPTCNECSALFNPFFNRLPVRNQEIQFSQFNLDRQYITYICGQQEVHPPAIYLVVPFAEKGRSAVPFLKKKLIETRNDSSIRDIIYVFSWMQLLKTYDVKTDKVLLELMNMRASEIRNQFWRTHTQSYIEEIEKDGNGITEGRTRNVQSQFNVKPE